MASFWFCLLGASATAALSVCVPTRVGLVARGARTGTAPRMMAAQASQDPPQQVSFPAPLTATERLARAASFWTKAVPVLFSYLRVYTGFQLREKLLGECLDETECEVIWDEEHDKGADTLARAINDLKGFYVKTGQIIASRQVCSDFRIATYVHADVHNYQSIVSIYPSIHL